MTRSFLSDLTSTTLAKSLDAASLRHSVIANNIANVETPGFKRSDVSFQTQLKNAMSSMNDTTATRNIERIQPEVETDYLSPEGPNGNNVSIDKEMAEMTKNNLEYEALVRLMNIKGNMLQTAITEGKR